MQNNRDRHRQFSKRCGNAAQTAGSTRYYCRSHWPAQPKIGGLIAISGHIHRPAKRLRRYHLDLVAKAFRQQIQLRPKRPADAVHQSHHRPIGTAVADGKARYIKINIRYSRGQRVHRVKLITQSVQHNPIVWPINSMIL